MKTAAAEAVAAMTKAEKDDEKRDRWLIDQKPNPVLADAARVDDLRRDVLHLRQIGVRTGPQQL